MKVQEILEAKCPPATQDIAINTDNRNSTIKVKKAGASCKGSVTDLRAKAKKASGEKAKMYHWCANMKSGKKK